MSAHVVHNDQPLSFSEPIQLDADALGLVDLLEAVELRNTARERETNTA